MMNKISITTLFALLTFGVWAQYYPVSSTDTVYPEGMGFRANLTQATKVRPVTPSGDSDALTMTTSPEALQTVNIYVAFTGSLTVDWGDGSEPEAMVGDGETPSSHEYATGDDYMITITGDLTSLTVLDCPFNTLTSLDVSSCTALTELYCYANSLTSLDVSSCTALSYLDCNSNSLTSLDVSSCTALYSLVCNSNLLSESAITALIGTMVDRTGTDSGIYVITPMNEACPATLTETQTNLLTTKNWTVATP